MSGSASRVAGARFVQGSIMGHIAVMTSTASIGLMALFLVDLADMYFLSLLGEAELAAAVGFAGSILFFSTSISIGIAIAMSALVSQAIGAGRRARARGRVVDVFVFALAVTIPLAAVFWFSAPWLLELLGATGRTLDLATSYLRIVLPTMPVLALAISCGGALRAVGDARGAMYSTLTGGAVNALLDPIFIFTLGLGVDGAAAATVAGRFAVLAVGLYGVVRKQDLLGRFAFGRFKLQVPAILGVAAPAIMTNVATPVGYAFVTEAIARFGDGAVAGYAVIGRIIPVAFGAVFALSGAIGPIFGQNLGAGRLDRVRRTLWDALIFLTVTVLSVSLLLFLLQDLIILAFTASEEAAELIGFFCTFIAIGYLFIGAQFIANAAFNNLRRPTWSTWSNWGRATLGTIPFVWAGAALAGAPGVLAGQIIGGLVFGLASFLVAAGLVARLGELPAAPGAPPRTLRVPLSAYTLYRGWTGIFSKD